MNLRRVILLLAAVGAAATSAQAVRSWLDTRERALAAAMAAGPVGSRQAVLVASEPLAVGSFVTPRALAWQDWPDVDVPSAYIVRGEAAPEDFAGAVARRDLLPGEPVTEEVLVRPGERGFLAAVLEPGMRAVSVAIDEATGNAGLVFPGDRVDLVLTQRFEGRDQEAGAASEIVLQDARVLAVGQRLSPASAERELPDARARTVTLEVTPEGAKRVALAQQLGTLVLSLRSLAQEPPAAGGKEITDTGQPLWDRQLSLAIGTRRGVLVMRGGESETVLAGTPPDRLEAEQ